MMAIQEIRFDQPYWKKQLMEANRDEFIEYNLWHDNFWGYCVCEKCRSKIKYNHLGNIIYDIRLKENER